MPESLNRFIESRVSRRSVIRGGVLGAAGLTAAALIGCGDDDEDAVAPAARSTPKPGTPVPTTPKLKSTPVPASAPKAAATAAPKATAAPAPAVPAYIANAESDGAPYAYGWEEPDSTPVSGGRFFYAATFVHASFDNTASGGGTTQLANSLIGDMLVGYNHGNTDFNTYSMELNPDFGLAKSWEVSPDGLNITFDLREAKFHNIAPVNGRELVAQDVALAYARMQAGRQVGMLKGLNRVDAVDDRTVKFNMDIPNADIIIVAGNRETPIYPQEVYDAGEQDTNPIGTGAGILDKSRTVQDQVMAFDANPDYWGGKPYLDGMDVLTTRDEETRRAMFRTGQSHYGLRIGKQIERDAIFETVPNMNVMANPSLMGINIIATNHNVAPFNDVRVRRAMKLGMDVDRYLAIFHPEGWPDSLPAFGWPFYSDTYPGRESFGSTAAFDPAESKKLLAAAGLEEGHVVKWRTPDGFAGRGTYTDLIIEDMAEIGLDLQTLPADGQAFARQYYSTGWSDPSIRDSDMLNGWSTAAPTANGYFWDNIHSESSMQHFDMNDAEVDRLSDAQFVEQDPAKRRELITSIITRFNDEAFWMDKVPASSAMFELRPEVRFWRFHGPYIGLHGFWDWGYGFHKAWLDPNPPAETLSIDLR